jgi:hypothetical protein
LTSLPGCLGAEGAVVEAPLESMAARTATIHLERLQMVAVQEAASLAIVSSWARSGSDRWLQLQKADLGRR